MSGKLSARKAATVGPGKHADGGGLYLFVKDGSRRWFFLCTVDGKRREMALGLQRDVTLAEARDLAAAARRLVRAGVNPIENRREAKRASAGIPTFGKVADELIEAKSPEWRNAKHREQWRVTLSGYAAPLRETPVDKVDTEAILRVLKPLWLEKPETASRVRGRIEAVLDAAKAQGHRSGENPAAWRGHLSHLLPKRQKLARGHHAAMAYADVPAFMARLRERHAASVSSMALEFCILTAARSGEVFGAQWAEVDLDAKVWTIPAARMKGGREHRVPLPERAVAILQNLSRVRTCVYIFPSPRGARPMAHIAMQQVMSRMGVEGPTVHGFRSAFRDWCGNETHFPREIAEAALAHTVGDRSEQAYRRGDALEKRRELMAAWAAYLEQKTETRLPEQPSKPSKVP